MTDEPKFKVTMIKSPGLTDGDIEKRFETAFDIILEGIKLNKGEKIMTIYQTRTTYHLTDNVTGETTAHKGDLSLPAVDATQAAAAAIEVLRLAAGKRATVTNIRLSVVIDHYATAAEKGETEP